MNGCRASLVVISLLASVSIICMDSGGEPSPKRQRQTLTLDDLWKTQAQPSPNVVMPMLLVEASVSGGRSETQFRVQLPPVDRAISQETPSEETGWFVHRNRGRTVALLHTLDERGYSDLDLLIDTSSFKTRINIPHITSPCQRTLSTSNGILSSLLTFRVRRLLLELRAIDNLAILSTQAQDPEATLPTPDIIPQPPASPRDGAQRPYDPDIDRPHDETAADLFARLRGMPQ